MATEKTKLDSVNAAILQRKLETIVAEMETTLVTTAYSEAINVSKHCSAALFTENGKLIAVSNPFYLMSITMTTGKVVEQFQFDLSGDDVILTNDPYGGGSSVQTLTMIAPVTFTNSIVMYLAVSGQTEDLGGDVRGNLNPRATELWAEAVRLTPLRLVREGKLQKDLRQTLQLNSRDPGALSLDLDALLGAITIGRNRIQDLIHTSGIEAVLEGINWTLDYSQKSMLALLSDLPLGRYDGAHTLTHDCHGQAKTVRVSVGVSAERVEFDFSGTDSQSSGFMNATPAVCATFAILTLVAALEGDIFYNDGTLRCFKILTPEGSLVNPNYPAPTGWGSRHIGYEICEAVSQALGKAIPDRVGLITNDALLLYAIHRDSRHGHTIEQLEFIDFSSFGQGGTNANSATDGWGNPGISSRVPLPSIELFEADHGGIIEQFEYLTDSGGAGKFRGSPGTIAVINLPAPASGSLYLTAVVTSEDQDGAEQTGRTNRISLSDREALSFVDGTLIGHQVSQETKLMVQYGGGSGFGSAYERSPDKVLRDVADELISIESANLDYGVVIDPGTLEVDLAATKQRRETSSDVRYLFPKD